MPAVTGIEPLRQAHLLTPFVERAGYGEWRARARDAVGDGAAAETLGSLHEACDVFLFYGLALPDRIEVADGMVLLPHGEVLRFVDEETVRDFAPSGAGFHGWGPVGTVARPFRWRPAFR